MLDAELTNGSALASDGGFPSAITSIQFSLNPPQKGYVVETKGSQVLNSAAAFVTLPGIGTSGPVTQAQLLYVRAPAGFKLRLTMIDPAGGADIVSIVTIGGILLQEFQSTGPLKLLEAEGVGTIEFYANGQS